jgi:hypothetical protein
LVGSAMLLAGPLGSRGELLTIDMMLRAWMGDCPGNMYSNHRPACDCEDRSTILHGDSACDCPSPPLDGQVDPDVARRPSQSSQAAEPGRRVHDNASRHGIGQAGHWKAKIIELLARAAAQNMFKVVLDSHVSTIRAWRSRSAIRAGHSVLDCPRMIFTCKSLDHGCVN